MKRSIIILLLIAIISCKGDDDNAQAQATTIDGEWSLITYSPHPFIPDPFDYAREDIVWDFNTSSNTVTVSIRDGILIDLIDVGTYNYDLIEHECNYGDNMFIVIEGLGFGTLILDNLQDDMLVISYACVDGSVIEFIKN